MAEEHAKRFCNIVYDQLNKINKTIKVVVLLKLQKNK